MNLAKSFAAEAKRKKKVEPKYVKAVNKKWVDSVPKRGFRSERQVDAHSIGEGNPGVAQISRRGLSFWFKPLFGYKTTTVIEFYRTIEINVDFENHDNDSISGW